MTLRLVIFDVDGTLIDSQAHILAAMAGAFDAHELAMPPRDAVLGIVGLSLPEAMARLAPEHPDRNASLVDAYKASFVELRKTVAAEELAPLFEGAADALAQLRARDDVLLGIATGKSRRGLDPILDHHGWNGWFQTIQTADLHPSKPHPSMVQACLSDLGIDARDAVMVGDTTYDVEMARSAGVTALGVHWGYQPAEMLSNAGAAKVLPNFETLVGAVDAIWSASA